MTTNINRIGSYLVLTSVLSLGGCESFEAWWKGDKPPTQESREQQESRDAAYRTFNEEQERAKNAVSNANSEYRKALSGRDKQGNKVCAQKITGTLDTFERTVRNKYQSVSEKGNAFLDTIIVKVIAGEKTTPEFKPWADRLRDATNELVEYSSNISIVTDEGLMCGVIQAPMSLPLITAAVDTLVSVAINVWKAHKAAAADQRKAAAEEMRTHKWPSWDILAKARFSDIKSSS